ncbi:hypothetical protein [Clostridium sp. ZS2-4]|uniref:hypothetical protein n=1 Tax=Clostridium sp. ZS2-4 TaxID=2987703 RepID=UPI00227BA6D0|nr:hypothetical protein [Clostridium sp. ZS2-4]MCY6354443.1 hypothetical protein [Clostridium sp. ZS2-4]
MKILLEESNTIDSTFEKEHITYECTLAKEYKKLKVIFEYSPKCLEDEKQVKILVEEALEKYVEGEELEKEKQNWANRKSLSNLLTVSLDDKNGFRGCVHRKDNKQELIISEEEATEGLIQGVIPPGIFKITISVHALVTRECSYKLYLYDMEENYD